MRATSRNIFTLSTALVLALALGCNRPSGNARTDQQIAGDVQAKLSNDHALPNGSAITVNSNNGAVTLAGTVSSEAERAVAAGDAQSVEGVKQVVNNLSMGNAGAMPAAPVPSNTSQPGRTTQSRRLPPNGGGYNSTKNAPGTSSGAMNNTTAQTPAAGRSTAPLQLTVPAGSVFMVRVNEALSSERSQPNDTFSGTLDSPIEVEGRSAIPQGADVQGRVVDAKNAAHYTGASMLALELTRVAFNGHSYRVVSSRWEKQGTARGKNTAAKVGGGAALGAIIGGIAGGGKGAAIGAGAGAAAGTGANTITRGQQVEVHPESLLSFTLQSPVTVTASSSNRDPNRQRLGNDQNNPQ